MTSKFEKLEKKIIDLKLELIFREYILREAKQSGILYHFTTPSKILEIINTQKIKKGNEKYVSLTRNFQLPNEKGYFNTGEYLIRLNIDGNNLSENYKISPISDINFHDDQEEGVLKDIPLKYVKEIDILISDSRIFSKEIMEFLVNDITKRTNIKIKRIKKFQVYKI